MFVQAWSKTTGKEMAVPEHYFEIPALCRNLTRDPAEGREVLKAFTREHVLIPLEEPAKGDIQCPIKDCDVVRKTQRAIDRHVERDHPDEQQTKNAGEDVDEDNPETTQSVDNPKE